MSDDIIPGDVVAVHGHPHGHREGLVVGSHYDSLGRHIVEIRLDYGDMYHAWYPNVRRLRRTTYYLPSSPRRSVIERNVLW